LGIKLGLVNCFASLFYVYIVCPVAQEPNRGTLQYLSWEQGYKNYIDKKYDLYRNADRDFYDCLTGK